MRRNHQAFLLLSIVGICVAAVIVRAAPPSIDTVEVKDRTFQVNDKPFFPLMVWLQDVENLKTARRCGMNTVAGYHGKGTGAENVVEYLREAREEELYGVMPFDRRLKGRPALLGYIHGDEPDLPHKESDAEVVPASELRINDSTPLWKIVDGTTHSWSVLDPLEGAAVTINLNEQVTVTRLAVHPTISKGLAVAKRVSFKADGKQVLDATLEKKKGKQEFKLAEPATFNSLTFKVHSTYPGDHVWGSIGEIEAYNAAGKNVLESPPRLEPRKMPQEVRKSYQKIKAHDPSRPVFMTCTAYFHPHFSKWSESRRKELYPAYIRSSDVVGYDVYPIYGWNKPEWIHLVHDATELLTEMAGERPVYAWVETSRGGQYTGALENQTRVEPRHIRAEVWMAICGGATGIGYFTHRWKPSYEQFGVPEENRKALARINAQITRLAPAILGRKLERSAAVSATDAKVDALFRRYGGHVYVFAVNYDEKQVKASPTFGIEGLEAGTEIEVIDEDRTVKARAGAFTDEFGPLAVHIYKLPVDSLGETQEATENGFEKLFAGDEIPSGWRVTHWSDVGKTPPENAAWKVEDGVLHGSEPRGTWLVSEKTYGDFILECEFKLPPQGNSGIGLRSPDSGDPAYAGLELQVVDPRYYAGYDIEPAQLTGAFYNAVAPKKQLYRAGEWNSYRIWMRGARVYVQLNGETIQNLDLDNHTAELERGAPLKERPRRGHIGFQELSRGEGHVQYRNIRLKVLD